MPSFTKRVPIIKVTFVTNQLTRCDIPRLRQYLARTFPKYELIHNHLQDGKYRYGYPLIQFKTVNSTPFIIGLGEGLPILKEVFTEVTELQLANRKQTVWEKSILLQEVEFGVTEEFYKYKFLSPWMALKEENFEKFKTLNTYDQQLFLKHLLRENLKTISKGCDYQIPEIEKVLVDGYFKPMVSHFKKIKMLCFTGDFTVNFAIPDLLGIGKQVARGYGTVKRVE